MVQEVSRILVFGLFSFRLRSPSTVGTLTALTLYSQKFCESRRHVDCRKIAFVVEDVDDDDETTGCDSVIRTVEDTVWLSSN